MQREEKNLMQMQMRKTAQKRNRFLQVMACMLVILTVMAALPMNPAQAAKTVKETYDWGTLYSDGSLTLKNTSAGYADVTAIKNYDKKSEVTEINCASGTKFPERCTALFKSYDNVGIIDLGNGDFSGVKTSGYNYMFVNLTRLTTVTLPSSFKSVTAVCALSNFDKGWARDDENGSRISGDGSNAVFTNSGKHTYYRIRNAITGRFSYSGSVKYNGTATIKCTASNCASEDRKYEWYRAGVLLPGVTGNTYKFTQADIGKLFVCFISDETNALKGRIKVELGTVAKQDKPAAPQNIKSVRPSFIGAADGKITGVDTTMEYRKKGDTAWKKCSGTEITGLYAGTYEVRYAETATRYASDAKSGTVQEGPAKLILDDSGRLTIYGALDSDDYWNFDQKQKVTSIVAADGAVLPRRCHHLFDEFRNCKSIDLSKADISKVVDMSGMFDHCSALKSLNMNWSQTANVTDMSGMFAYCEALTSLNLSKINTANVTDMSGMFAYCEALTSLNLSGFNTANVTDMNGMFAYCEALTSLNLSGFNTANVTDMSNMFLWCISLTSLDVTNFNTANVTNMNSMFSCCISLTSLDVTKFNTAKVNDMGSMFSFCKSLTSLDVTKFNTANVTNMRRMFSFCESLTSLDLSNFKTDKVTSMVEMFSSFGSETIQNLDLTSFNTANVTDMNGMFLLARMKSLDLSSFVINDQTDVDSMLYSDELVHLTLGAGIKKIDIRHDLRNGSHGWYRGNDKTVCVSGHESYAVITNSGKNTYHKDTYLDGYIILKFNSLTCGETITADVSLYDGNKENLVYQWIRDGQTVIPGANTNTYTICKDDVGKKVTCVATDKTGLYKGSLSKSTIEYGNISDGPAPTAVPVTQVFTDIKSTAWYVKAVQYVYDKDVMSGKGSEFQPNTPVTREEFAQTLYNHIGKPTVSIFVTNHFPDVKAGKWYMSAVLWAKDKDIVKGYATGKFGVGDKITREQLAQMLYKYAKLRGYNLTLTSRASTGYKDSNKRSDWAYTALDWAVSQGIISGKGTSGAPKSQLLLDPKGNATRAECAQMVMKLLQKNGQ